MTITKSAKSMMGATLFVALIGLTACQKDAEEMREEDKEAEVVMSAEPAEGNDPVIVADDLDDVDAQSEEAINGETSLTDPNTELEVPEATEGSPTAEGVAVIEDNNIDSTDTVSDTASN